MLKPPNLFNPNELKKDLEQNFNVIEECMKKRHKETIVNWCDTNISFRKKTWQILIVYDIVFVIRTMVYIVIFFMYT